MQGGERDQSKHASAVIVGSEWLTRRRSSRRLTNGLWRGQDSTKNTAKPDGDNIHEKLVEETELLLATTYTVDRKNSRVDWTARGRKVCYITEGLSIIGSGKKAAALGYLTRPGRQAGKLWAENTTLQLGLRDRPQTCWPDVQARGAPPGGRVGEGRRIDPSREGHKKDRQNRQTRYLQSVTTWRRMLVLVERYFPSA